MFSCGGLSELTPKVLQLKMYAQELLSASFITFFSQEFMGFFWLLTERNKNIIIRLHLSAARGKVSWHLV